jgi:hypothetical protein
MATQTVECSLCGLAFEYLLPPAPLGKVVVVNYALCSTCATREHLEAGGLITRIREPLPGARFPLGTVSVAPGAAQALADARQGVVEFLSLHVTGDWGCLGHLDRTTVTDEEIQHGAAVTDNDAKLNKISVITGFGSVMGEHRTSKGKRIWVFTEITDRPGTTVMLPEEY